jgi:hypothetical protein
LSTFGSPAGGAAPRRSGTTGGKAPVGAGARADEKGTTVLSLVEKAVDRLEEVVDQETAALQARRAVDLKEFNDRKSQGLLELTRAMRHMQGAAPDAAAVARLASLRGKLELNRAALKLHLDAVREISTVVADAMRNADSDGTYARPIGGYGNLP